jgi:hypothetical protein
VAVVGEVRVLRARGVPLSTLSLMPPGPMYNPYQAIAEGIPPATVAVKVVPLARINGRDTADGETVQVHPLAASALK